MSTKTFYSKCLLLFMLCSLTVTACGAPAPVTAPQPPPGEVWTAATNTTVYWVNQAFNGANFTQIMTNSEGAYFVIWNPSGANGVGFTLIRGAGTQPSTVVLDWVKATGGKGNLVNFRDMSGVVNALKEQGWKTITAAEVAGATKTIWSNAWASVSAGMSITGGVLISIIVIPVTTMPNELLTPYQDATIIT